MVFPEAIVNVEERLKRAFCEGGAHLLHLAHLSPQYSMKCFPTLQLRHDYSYA